MAINKTFFVFHPILMKLDEIVVHMDNYNFTNFHQNWMKNKKVLLRAHLSVQNYKVSVELWKSYIVSHSYSHYLLHYFSIFIAHCALQPAMVGSPRSQKSSFFPLPKFMAWVFTKISLFIFTLFFGSSKKKYNVAKKKKTKDLMWIWKKPVWSSILNDPAWWRAFHSGSKFEKNMQFI